MTTNGTGVNIGLDHQVLSEHESENTSGIICFKSNKTWRMVLGVCVLLAVDLIWVASAELTDFIFHKEGFDKPFFTTYFKTSCFMLYLIGFAFYRPWQHQCILLYRKFFPKNSISNAPVTQNSLITQDSGNEQKENSALLSTNPAPPSPSQVSLQASSSLTYDLLTEPEFEQITDEEVSYHDSKESSGSKYVRFNNIREVRSISTHLSCEDSEEVRAANPETVVKLPLRKVAKVSLMFCVLWFFASFDYQQAIAETTPAAVNILSSSSGLFTLILGSIFPSSTSDAFTVSKLLAVALSICGIVLVTLSDSTSHTGNVNFGAIWALASAFLYACYLVMLRKKVPDERKIDITMFFGLVGLFNFLLLWPGFFILHYSNVESFTFPGDASVWAYLVLNAFVGTVLAEFLWLWGCYLTSALTATLALSLVMPLTMLVDIYVKSVQFSWLFYVGSVPLFASFFAVSLLSHYADWDPVLVVTKRLFSILLCEHCRERKTTRRHNNHEETKRLISDVDHRPA